ncbi:hypothetical protein F383_37664 [Gossypium arboreum]|nr:hypothetical protein F383_37664 [Gossypium arboreum]
MLWTRMVNCHFWI